MKIEDILEKNNLIIEQAVILTSGLGMRIEKKSLNFPAPIKLFNGEPFLSNIIWNLKRHGIKKIILSIDYLANNLRNYYGDGSKLGVEISFIQEEFSAGTCGALRQSKILLDDYFLLINGDNLFDVNYHDLAQTFEKNKLGHLALNFVSNSKRYCEVKTKGNIIFSFKENRVINSGYINTGVAIFHKKILDYIPIENSPLEKEVFQNLISKRFLSARKYNSFFLDISNPLSLKDAEVIISKWKRKSALFLDRDGVINIDYGFVHSMDNFKYIKGAKEIIKMANDFGILVIVVTNQSGIARGLYNIKEFNSFTEEINNDLKKYGAHIDATYFCPHHPKEGIREFRKNCNCRKPKTGMITQAIKEWNLEKNKCFLIGDKDSDIIAANRSDISSCIYSENKDLVKIFKEKLPTLTS